MTLGYTAQGQRNSYTVTPRGQSQPSLTMQFRYRDDLVGQVVVSGTQRYTDTYLYQQDGTPLELLRQQGGTTSRYWYVLDGLGSVVALTDASGSVVDRYSYDLWGEPETVSETVPQQLRYNGYWYDSKLGWYWVSVRSYDPEGRWLQPDPSETDGVRTYVYVGDDPSDRSDPTGRQECLEGIGFTATPDGCIVGGEGGGVIGGSGGSGGEGWVQGKFPDIVFEVSLAGAAAVAVKGVVVVKGVVSRSRLVKAMMVVGVADRSNQDLKGACAQRNEHGVGGNTRGTSDVFVRDPVTRKLLPVPLGVEEEVLPLP